MRIKAVGYGEHDESLFRPGWHLSTRSKIEALGESGVVRVEKRKARDGAGWWARYWSDPNAFGPPVEAIAATLDAAVDQLFVAASEER